MLYYVHGSVQHGIILHGVPQKRWRKLRCYVSVVTSPVDNYLILTQVQKVQGNAVFSAVLLVCLKGHARPRVTGECGARLFCALGDM